MSTQLVPELKGIKQSVLVGWKAAYVYVTGDEMEELRFVSIVQPTHFGIEEAATCAFNRDHASPNDECKCGFYVWHNADAARQYLYERMALINYYGARIPRASPRSLVVLRVTLHGSAFRGYLRPSSTCPNEEWISRGSNQWVHDVFFEKKCTECASDKVRLGYASQLTALSGFGICRSLRPLCDEHMYQEVSISKLMSRNNVDVHWGLPSK